MDLLLRRQLLYPAELQGRVCKAPAFTNMPQKYGFYGFVWHFYPNFAQIILPPLTMHSLLAPADDYYMHLALEEARAAFAEGEVPIGAVVVCRGQVIARTHNQTERLRDVTAHAEMLALTAAALHLGNKYLSACTLYVTLEPCPMCAGALLWAQIGRIVYAAPDPKRGYAHFSEALRHPKTELTTGVLAEPAAELLKAFFKAKR